jgi:hypothetical protein
MTLSILRAGTEIATINIGEDTLYTKKIMGEHKIVAVAVATTPLPIQIGDYIVHNSDNYYINRLPLVDKINNITYNYTIVFESALYRLYDKKLMHTGDMDFSYHGTAQDHLDLIITNINLIDGGTWTGIADTTDSQTITYSNQSCRNALNTIAEAFGLEYKLIGKAIYMQKSINVASNLTFEYGKGKGLYKLTRRVIDDKNIITRAYGFGGTKNIDYNYRNGAHRLQFLTGTGDSYIESNTALYGIKEGVFKDDTIYPQRTSTITAVDGSDLFQCTDSALDFDINSYLVEGVVAKIVFKSGDLSGYEFEINKYDPATKTIYFNLFTEENSTVLPDANNKVAIGDSYTLVDIAMPQSYINTAELDLYNKTVAFLAENDHPRVIYDIVIDEKYIRDNGIALDVATLVTVIDTELGINSQIRIAELSYPLVNTDKVTAVISDSVPYTLQERIIVQTLDTKKVTKDIDRTQSENARLGATNLRKLQQSVYDPDGYFDTNNIRPNSIETLMLAVGAKSQNFGLGNVSIKPNYTGDANKLRITAGQLMHYEIEITGLGYIWQTPLADFNTLVGTTQYYVYAKCSKTALTGTWEVFTTPQKTEDITGYYLFYVGILYPVASGRRDFDFTKGMTFIVGDTITSGKIQSLDGLNFFDLTNGTWQIGSGSGGSIDYSITTPDTLTINKAYITELIFATNAVLTNLIVDTLKTATTGERVEAFGSTMKYFDSNGDLKVKFEASPIVGLSGINLFSSILYGDAFSMVYFDSGDPLVLDTKVGSGLIQSPLVRLGGLEVGVKIISANYTVTGDKLLISCYNTSDITVTMPPLPNIGFTIEIRRNNASAVNLAGNGNSFLVDTVKTSWHVGNGAGDKAVLIWDGSYWLYNYVPR